MKGRQTVDDLHYLLVWVISPKLRAVDWAALEHWRAAVAAAPAALFRPASAQFEQ